MEITFEDKSVRALCIKQERARQVLGPEVAEALMVCLSDLRAADNIGDILTYDPTVLPGTRGAIISLALRADHHVIIQAGHIRNPISANGDVDWRRVSRVRITKIGKPNG